MSTIEILGAESLVTPSFPRTACGLWDAILGTLTDDDRAGSLLTGPAWPGQPRRSERGMFDIVVHAPGATAG